MATREEHRKAFDLLAELLRQSLFLIARAWDQNRVTDRATVLAQVFDHSVDRIGHLYGRSSYQSLPLSHLYDSAVHGEALLAYEYQREADTLDAKDPLHAQYLQQAVRHGERIDGFINAARRANNLDIAPQRPFVMPYRGVFIFPYSEEVRILLVRDREYFVRWNNGIVAVVRDDGIEAFREITDEVTVLHYDADELLEQGAKLSKPDLEAIFAERLESVGEVFAHHLNRCLLKQSVVLRNLHPRLEDEHPAAHAYCEPLVAENTRQLQAQLQAHPSWAPENFREDSDCVKLLTELEQQIQAHTTAWVQQARVEDAAGLLFQFESVLQADDLLRQLGEL